MKKLSVFLIAMMVFGTLPAYAHSKMNSATVQDVNNIVLQWSGEVGDFEIYRSDQFDGNYELIGTSKTGSYRDDTVDASKIYYYKILNKSNNEMSDAIRSGDNAQPIKSVYVIMYHHFVTDEDISNGTVFEEYSLRLEDFEKDLMWLRDNGFTTITSDDLIKYMNKEKSLPEKAIILSIDDGTWGVYKNAYPLLKKYNMKADFNIIGEIIDGVWENLSEGGTRDGEEAPYCTWEEIVEMHRSGVINICSHSYGMHAYNRKGRIGMQAMNGESENEFIAAHKEDYRLVLSSIEGWTGEAPETVAYPYSNRDSYSDKIILENTGYKLLMGGEDQRGSAINHFVDGCDYEQQLKLLSRPCRMDGHPISEYIEKANKADYEDGIIIQKDILLISPDECIEIGSDYNIFTDVKTNDWFSGCAYYSYLNGFIKGVSYTEFSPRNNINRAMAATLLHRLAGNPSIKAREFSDVPESSWYADGAKWTVSTGLIRQQDNNKFFPDSNIIREDLVYGLYKCAKYMGYSVERRTDLTGFSDSNTINAENKEAMQWAVSVGVIKGNGDGTLNPKGCVTRAEMAALIQSFFVNVKGEIK